MKKIFFINGSATGKSSFSFEVLKALDEIIEDDKSLINVNLKGRYEDDVFKKLITSDAIVISFPLYYHCLSGLLIDLLQQFYEYMKDKNKKSIKVYVIVNSGFPEPKENEYAIKVIESFCNRAGFDFRFAVSIGGGRFINTTKNVFLFKRDMLNVKNVLKNIKDDIYKKSDNKSLKNIMIKPFLPKAIVLFIAKQSWYYSAKKNGLRKGDLFRKPYIQN